MKVFMRVIILIVITSPAFARVFQVEDMQKLLRVGRPVVSPDGQRIAFAVTRSDVAKNKSVTNLWMVASTGGAPQQLTFAERGSNDNPRWSPDAHYLYFISSRLDDKPQIFRLSMAGGEARQITKFPTGVED